MLCKANNGRERGLSVHNIILARYSGICACGGTIGPNDVIEWKDGVIASCFACGLVTGQGFRYQMRADVETRSNDLRRQRAGAIVTLRASIARFEAAMLRADESKRARLVVTISDRKAQLIEALEDAKGKPGERPWARPSERDIELAEQRRAQEEARREAEET